MLPTYYAAWSVLTHQSVGCVYVDCVRVESVLEEAQNCRDRGSLFFFFNEFVRVKSGMSLLNDVVLRVKVRLNDQIAAVFETFLHRRDRQGSVIF
jgi:hypothetical protein